MKLRSDASGSSHIIMSDADTITVERGEWSTPTPAHPTGARIYAYSELMLRNLVDRSGHENQDVHTSAWTRVKSMRSTLYSSFADSYQPNVIELPVLFELDGPRWAPATANLVNGLSVPGHGHFMQDPGNTHWANYVSGVLGSSVFLNQVEFWDNYHRGKGSIHCGTATMRSVDFSIPWWNRFTTWP